MDSLSTGKDIAVILGTIVALTTFLSGALEYIRQGHQTRAQHFLQMRRRFLETGNHREILNMLADDDPKLRDIPIQDKRNLLGFIEEVALIVNSRLIRREVAGYMFGYYVLLCARSDNLWHGLDKDSLYWSVFRNFAADMGEFERGLKINAKHMKF